MEYFLGYFAANLIIMGFFASLVCAIWKPDSRESLIARVVIIVVAVGGSAIGVSSDKGLMIVASLMAGFFVYLLLWLGTKRYFEKER